MEKVKLDDKLFFDRNIFNMIEHEEEFVFTTSEKFKWFKTARTGYDILMHLDSKNTVGEVIDKISDEYELESNMIEDDIVNFCSNLLKEEITRKHDENEKIIYDDLLKTVYIDVTDACNLECKYCNKCIKEDGELANYMTFDEYKKNLEGILLGNDSKIPLLYISGGEPMLHPQIFEILEYSFDKGFDIFLFTNGTLIKEEHIEKIKKYCSYVVVSLDGSSAESNDLIRGEATYNKIINTCNLLRENKVAFLMATTPINDNLDDLINIYSLSYNLGAKGFFLNEPIFIKENGEDISRYFNKDQDSFKEIEANLSKQSILVSSWKNNRLKEKKEGESGTIYFKDVQRCFNNPMRIEKKLSCGSCINEISIGVDSMIHPCHNLHTEKFTIGKIDTYYEVRDEYEKSVLDTVGECNNCFYWIFCLGGCKAKTLFYTNNLNSLNTDCNKVKQEYHDFLVSPLQAINEDFDE